ncbi:hypothetical protein B484DRAFT_438699, partial [Ochromonadaceae sp. CCMP2298]
ASVAPYLLSWTLYQGPLLIILLNWTGLVVNGLVAFLLPMLLVLKAMQRFKGSSEEIADVGAVVLVGGSAKGAGGKAQKSAYHRAVMEDAGVDMSGMGGSGEGEGGAGQVQPHLKE